ncbi:MAG: hypothetical protein LUC38_02970 [Oscillospiraceae bacterium]|nr:hypothetical protein [Ruminococcus sp.]MCD8344907.1 hypothetical protein [Oscillospiraceae bacterium]
MTFEEVCHELMQEVLPEIRYFCVDKWAYCSNIWRQIPVVVKGLLFIVFFIAIFGVVASFVRAVFNNYKAWKPDSGSKLMRSFFAVLEIISEN